MGRVKESRPEHQETPESLGSILETEWLTCPGCVGAKGGEADGVWIDCDYCGGDGRVTIEEYEKLRGWG